MPGQSTGGRRAQAEYSAARGSCLLCDYLALEHRSGERLVCENEFFAAVVPFWAVWPFEIFVASRRHRTGIDQFDVAERDALAAMLKEIAVRYDNLFECSFPYSMGFHQRPTGGDPPLLRELSGQINATDPSAR